MNNHFLLATGNAHKIEEVLALTPDIAWKTLADFPELAGFSPEETGSTFAENAELKARAYCEKTGLGTVAEDSGLEVLALGGEPGVYSARWVAGTDQDRNQALLDRMKGKQDRTARYIAVICVFFPGTGEKHFFEGTVFGKIAETFQGAQGFGYDPLFIPEGYTDTFATLGSGVKHTVSHRKKAFESFLAWYQQQ